MHRLLSVSPTFESLTLSLNTGSYRNVERVSNSVNRMRLRIPDLDDDEFNVYRATHVKRNFLSALPTVTPPAGFILDRNNGCDFDIQMHGCLDLFYKVLYNIIACIYA